MDIPQGKISMNKLWKQTGCEKPFKDFCEEFNAKQGFKNFSGDTNLPPVATSQQTIPIDSTADIASTSALPAAKPVGNFDQKQAFLYLSFGIALGIVGVLAYKHLRK